MSCNGCRVLRKGCSETCMLRPCLQWIDSPEAQGHATVFVAKFFGRAGLMSFISSVPEKQRPSLFQSLLFEACGRTVNPVNGAVGLLWTGNWHVCQTAVETVLRGGTLQALPDLPLSVPLAEDAYESCHQLQDLQGRSKAFNRKSEEAARMQACDLDLSLKPGFPAKFPMTSTQRRPASPSEGSSVTTSDDSDRKLLNLFV